MTNRALIWKRGDIFITYFDFFSTKVTVNSDICGWNIFVKSTRNFLPQNPSQCLYKWKISVYHTSLHSLNVFVGHMLLVTSAQRQRLFTTCAPEIKRNPLKELSYLFKRTRSGMIVTWSRFLSSLCSFQWAFRLAALSFPSTKAMFCYLGVCYLILLFQNFPRSDLIESFLHHGTV